MNSAVCSFDRSLINAPGPCVLFATPGMISGGFSLEVFRQWAPCEGNLVMLPGYCVAGTIGHKLLSAKVPTKINIDRDTQIDVRCQIHQLSFSPHTDAKGIMDLIKFLSPKHVILVHGEKPKLAALKAKIHSELGIQSYDPANNDTLCIPSTLYIKPSASDAFLQSSLCPNFTFLKNSDLGDSDPRMEPLLRVCDDRVAQGLLTSQKNQNPRVVNQNELITTLGVRNHEIKFAHCCPVSFAHSENVDMDSSQSLSTKGSYLLHLLYKELTTEFSELSIQDSHHHIKIQSFIISLCSKEQCLHRTTVGTNAHDLYFCCTWLLDDEKVAWKVISFMKNINLSRASN
ncbi:cleavage and polyadenylation specificity factor subunit 3-II [Dorcoceras hygrometricum]|uniref:Cleavage and polyadenylation specificity factor subunit 3-II n=1 Tax=Dorcoceras hygrometricum TaxID=472368 RepID=A0A2Z7D6F2_9LAMI|nr:cleavage and polyadenylation specificity factor subunit 3-II [Dorcoceras hygrometricum]